MHPGIIMLISLLVAGFSVKSNVNTMFTEQAPAEMIFIISKVFFFGLITFALLHFVFG